MAMTDFEAWLETNPDDPDDHQAYLAWCEDLLHDHALERNERC